MPLPYTVTEPLNVPTAAFNSDGIAVLRVGGGRYGGDWVIDALDGGQAVWGSIETCYDLGRDDLTKDARYPDLALDSAFVWLNGEAKKRGWRLIFWESLNSGIPQDEKPYFTVARAMLASEHFVPMDGVTYADELPR